MHETARRIQELMKERGMSYQTLSDMTGLSRSGLHRYTTCATEKMKLDNVEKIAKALCVSASYLMGWTDNPMPTKKEVTPTMSKTMEEITSLLETASEETQEQILQFIQFALQNRK